MMKKTKILSLTSLLLVLVCALMAFTFTACGSKVKITLSQTEITVAEGGKANIVATVAGSTEELTWEIDNNEVAEFNTIGKMCIVTAKKLGTAKITASIGKAHAECKVTVTADTTEKVTITLDGAEVTEHTMDMKTQVTLAATASNGSAIIWESSNENIATVENGLVKALRPGNVTISAKVSASIKAEVALTVNAVDGYEYYELTLKNGAADAAANPGKWAYWTEWAQFTVLNYDNGTVNLEFTENGGNWYNIQLFNVNPSIVAAKYYKLSCTITSSAAGHATLNGNVIEIQEGTHEYEVYFTNGTGFSMQFGVEGSALDIPAATVAISNIAYEEDTQRVTLAAPSFTFDADTNEITITDTNTAGVKNYVLNLYQNDKKITGVTVAGSGVKVDLSKVLNGEYDAKLQAIAANVHYIDSEESATSVKITVNNEGGLSYGFHNAGDDPENNTPMDGNGVNAIAQAGIWTYWCSSWVNIDGKFADDKLTVEFSNNSGNWYDTQLFYKVPGLESGKIYCLTLAIDSTAGGKVTLNGKEFTINEGAHDYEVVFTAGDGLSLQFTFGLNGQNNAQEIKSAKMIMEIKSTEVVEQQTLTAPSFTYDADTKIIAITDTNTAGVGSYELGFFQNDELKTSVTVSDGAELNLSSIAAGEYAIKLRAKASSDLYITSDWSETSFTITSETENVPIGFNEEANLTSGWAYYDTKTNGGAADWNVNTATECTECYIDKNGNVTMSYTCEGNGAAWAMQMFYKDGTNAAGYNVSFTITSTVATSITACGQTITLEANVAQTVTATNYTSATGNHSAIDIQFGFNGGTFVLSDISVTAVA